MEAIEEPTQPVEVPDTPAQSFSLAFDETDAILVRDAARREVDVRIVPWGVPIETLQGREQFEPGAFDGTDPANVLLMGLEHEASIGLGQDGKPVLVRHPMGRAISLENRPDGEHGTFRVARTAAGDDFLALAADGIVRGVSAEFRTVPGGTQRMKVDGRPTNRHYRVALGAVSPTYRPAFAQAEILAVRSESAERETPVAEPTTSTTEVVPVQPSVDYGALLEEFRASNQATQQALAAFMENLGQIQERNRSEFTVPTAPSEPGVSIVEWAETALKILTGDRVPDAQMRAMADVISTDNAGVVPAFYLPEMIGKINLKRPFLASTRQIPTPDYGMKITVPKITQRPTTAKQTTEKTEVSSTTSKIGTVDFEAISIAGAGDLSLQIIKRATRNFLQLWFDLLGEQYAADCESEALAALFTARGGYHERVALDPNALSLGAAFINSFDAFNEPPDTIWLSTEAVGEFIDAKATTTNQPLYSSLRTEATAAGGIAGLISGLRAVHVPALDAHGCKAIVGPSAGFAWAEDGSYQLQVDVPSKAGRDVGLVGMLWPVPWYPDAFTVYNVAS